MEYAKWVFYLMLINFVKNAIGVGSMLMQGAAPKENSYR